METRKMTRNKDKKIEQEEIETTEEQVNVNEETENIITFDKRDHMQEEDVYEQENTRDMDMLTLFNLITAKLDVNQHELEKKIEENAKNIEVNVNKKIEENSKKMGENVKQMKRIIEENNESLKKKIEEGYNKFEKKMILFKTEVRDEITEHKKQTENDLEKLYNIYTNKIGMEERQRKQEIEKTRQEVEQKLQENQEKVKKKVEEVKQEVHRKLEDFEDVLKVQERKQEDTYKSVEEKLGMLEERRIVEGKMFISGRESEFNLKFNGNIRMLHPQVYLNSLKNKVRHITNIIDIKDIIRQSMIEGASTWYACIDEEIDCIENFERKFLNYYWGEVEQARFRETLYFKKFDYNRCFDLVNYALKLFTVSKYLTPPLREDEVMLNVARHFRPEVIETVTIQNIKKMDQFINFLTRIQRGSFNQNDNFNLALSRNRTTNNRDNTNFNNQNYNAGRFNPNYEYRSNNMQNRNFNNRQNQQYNNNNFRNNYNQRNRENYQQRNNNFSGYNRGYRSNEYNNEQTNQNYNFNNQRRNYNRDNNYQDEIGNNFHKVNEGRRQVNFTRRSRSHERDERRERSLTPMSRSRSFERDQSLENQTNNMSVQNFA